MDYKWLKKQLKEELINIILEQKDYIYSIEKELDKYDEMHESKK